MSSPALGHLYPMVPTLWALRAAGCDVRVAVPAYFARAVLQTGLAVLACTQPAAESVVVRDEDWTDEFTEDVRTLRRFARISEAMGPELAEIVASWRPDLVLSDQIDLAGRRTAAEAGVTYVEHRWGLSLPDRTRSMAAAQVFGDSWQDWPGLGRPAALTVDPCPPSFQIPGARPGVLTRYLPFNGPSLPPQWLASPPHGKARILVTFGTVWLEGGQQTALLDAAVNAALSAGAEVLVAADRTTVPRRVVERVRAVRWIPVGLAAHHCDLVIHHGGSGTTLSAMAAGTPQVLCPGSFDELDNARRLTELQAGVSVPGAAPEPDALLTQAVTDVLGHAEYRVEAERLRAEIAATPAPSVTAGIITELITPERSRHVYPHHARPA
ncbi:glycosyltransferase [Phytoactinopolyspora limicola]|uniref:glycosyltransferase n=1 Tax=Phytoactinopolyspora limicola TaxID=2715536 RepID=UPI00140D2AE9|nr:glycosyltransferase [Phytoactinopolyspora limicola]